MGLTVAFSCLNLPYPREIFFSKPTLLQNTWTKLCSSKGDKNLGSQHQDVFFKENLPFYFRVTFINSQPGGRLEPGTAGMESLI